ncbi:MAG: hypothetical protein ACE3JQ_02935 [Paenisporosarcina sp.]
MSLAKYRLQLKEKKFKDTIKSLKFIETIKSIINMYLEKRKTSKANRGDCNDERELNPQSSNLNRFVRTIRDIFGLTAVMSIIAIFILGIFSLSFFMPTLLDYFRDYRWLTIGMAGVMLGVGMYKPFKLWSASLTLLGSFLLVISFGPLVIEGYTGRELVDVHYTNGYWLTLKATIVFVIYLISAITFITWIYLVFKGRRQNPLKWLRYVKFKTKNE